MLKISYGTLQDTIRRCKDLDQKGILYVGSGVSGGEEGARHGPSLMPGWLRAKALIWFYPLASKHQPI